MIKRDLTVDFHWGQQILAIFFFENVDAYCKDWMVITVLYFYKLF